LAGIIELPGKRVYELETTRGDAENERRGMMRAALGALR
jgi:hypothetical protein